LFSTTRQVGVSFGPVVAQWAPVSRTHFMDSKEFYFVFKALRGVCTDIPFDDIEYIRLISILGITLHKRRILAPNHRNVYWRHRGVLTPPPPF